MGKRAYESVSARGPRKRGSRAVGGGDLCKCVQKWVGEERGVCHFQGKCTEGVMWHRGTAPGALVGEEEEETHTLDGDVK